MGGKKKNLETMNVKVPIDVAMIIKKTRNEKVERIIKKEQSIINWVSLVYTRGSTLCVFECLFDFLI